MDLHNNSGPIKRGNFLQAAFLCLCALFVVQASAQNVPFKKDLNYLGGDPFIPRSIDSADFDGDGKLDILCTFRNARHISWFRNAGHGTFETERVIATDYNPHDAKSIDFDGDGDQDFVGLFRRKIALYDNIGKGEFKELV
jgi:hypothetical protein